MVYLKVIRALWVTSKIPLKNPVRITDNLTQTKQDSNSYVHKFNPIDATFNEEIAEIAAYFSYIFVYGLVDFCL